MNINTLKLTIILAALDMNKSELAEAVGSDRTAVSKVLHQQRVNREVREKVATEICSQIRSLILETPKPVATV